MSPKVFVSHASDDKDRFVLEFARRLRERGVDVWLDAWEMLPGDSLVDKLFEEGIGNAAAVIVVLSRFSVEKPWVREEINAAFIKRVNKGSKLIPVVLDGCQVPEALASTLWETIEDVNSYERSFERILSAITGMHEKPPIGPLPTYAVAPIFEIAGVARVDNLVLKAICERALEVGHENVSSDELSLESLSGISKSELSDSLDILENENLISLTRFLGAEMPYIKLLDLGFQRYAKAYMVDYETKVNAVAAAIVNEKLYRNEEIQSKFEIPSYFVDHILSVLERNGYIQMSRFIGGEIRIHDVSAKLRRAIAR